MNGVDIFDQSIKYYSLQRKTNRWTFKLSTYFLDLLIYNSYILYKTICSTNAKTRLDYNIECIKWFSNWNETDKKTCNLKNTLQPHHNNKIKNVDTKFSTISQLVKKKGKSAKKDIEFANNKCR